MSNTSKGEVWVPGFYKGLGMNEDASSILVGSNSLSVANLVTVAAGSAPLPTAITLVANSTSVTPLTFQSGSLNTTPVAGGAEYDGTAFYATSVASARQLIATPQFQSLTADYALNDVNTAQAAFNGTSSGALTVAASTAYNVDMVLMITNTGTTSHTWSILFAGSSTITAAGSALIVQAYTGTTSAATLTAVSGNYIIGSGISSATAVTAASTSSTENVVIVVKGRININGAGTLIPQVKMSAAANGGGASTETIKAGSYVSLYPLGAGTVVSVGNWS